MNTDRINQVGITPNTHSATVTAMPASQWRLSHTVCCGKGSAGKIRQSIFVVHKHKVSRHSPHKYSLLPFSTESPAAQTNTISW